ncbi:hypothetical protein QF034_007172 [Streptomyces africanus]|uniref:Fructose-bisphosphate aldolase n=1 Tax=Streptomyces africanus TaxID=231024 RepID=A0ABU0QZX0_9ACTN|nr:hypothetical protein [Streptomyces africanus]
MSATGVDALAVAVGSSHAMTTRTARLDHGLIARLAAAVPVPLVLHGSTGVPDGELRKAVAAGMVKVNIGTALNAAFTGAVRHPRRGARGRRPPARPHRGAPGDGRCRDVGAAGAVGRRVRISVSRAAACTPHAADIQYLALVREPLGLLKGRLKSSREGAWSGQPVRLARWTGGSDRDRFGRGGCRRAGDGRAVCLARASGLAACLGRSGPAGARVRPVEWAGVRAVADEQRYGSGISCRRRWHGVQQFVLVRRG